MNQRIKTTISANNNIFDVNGQWLPKGNYYFCIHTFTSTTAKGELFERSFNAEYEFTLIDLVKMMSIAQARLARRANISNRNMPSSASPTLSPVSRPDEFNFNVSTRERVNESTNTEMCTICLEEIMPTECKTLICNHSFHNICINRWLSTNTNCPICRRFIRNRNSSLPVIENERRVFNYNNQAEIENETNTYPIIYNRRNRSRGRSSNVRITPVITRNNPVVRPRSPIRLENIRRPISRSRQREYNRIYSSANTIIR